MGRAKSATLLGKGTIVQFPLPQPNSFFDDLDVPEYTRADIVNLHYTLTALSLTQIRNGQPVPLNEQVIELARRAIRFSPRPPETVR